MTTVNELCNIDKNRVDGFKPIKLWSSHCFSWPLLVFDSP